ncbi:unnamed protein product [Arctogadus glacialis]
MMVPSFRFKVLPLYTIREQDGECGEVREWKAVLVRQGPLHQQGPYVPAEPPPPLQAASTVRSVAGMEKWVIQSEVVWNRARPEVTRIITENKTQKQKAVNK